MSKLHNKYLDFKSKISNRVASKWLPITLFLFCLGFLPSNSVSNNLFASSLSVNSLANSLIFDQKSESTQIEFLEDSSSPEFAFEIPEASRPQSPAKLPQTMPMVATPDLSNAGVTKINTSPSFAPRVAKISQPVAKSSSSEETSTVQSKPATLAVAKVRADKSTTDFKEALRPRFEKGNILVFDEEALNLGSFSPIQNARVFWFGHESSVQTRTNSNGVARFPQGEIYSARFIVKAEGYLPAVGYAKAGLVTPIALYSEKRLPAILKSLNIGTDFQSRFILGKILSPSGEPVSDVHFDLNESNKQKAFFSAGKWSLFVPNLKGTGPSGDFLFSGLQSFSFDYFLPTRSDSEGSSSELSSQPFSFSGIDQIASVTLVESPPSELSTQIVDSSLLEFDAGLSAVGTIGGQGGVYTPNSEGFITFEKLSNKTTVDLVEVRARGYRKAWLSPSPSTPKSMPDFLPLFTEGHLIRVFEEAHGAVNPDLGMVLGNLRPEFFNEPVEVKILGPSGTQISFIEVFYFDADNNLDSNLMATAPETQNFAIPNLIPGEWHLQIRGTISGELLATQVVRTSSRVVSYVQF